MREKKEHWFRSLVKNPVFYLIFTMAVISSFVTLLNPRFASFSNLMELLRQVSVLGMITMALSLVMISGGLDLSLGAMMGLIAVVATQLIAAGYGVPFAVLVSLVAGCGLGLLNGVLIAKSKAVPLIITLGMMSVYLGGSMILAGGEFSSLAGKLLYPGQGELLGIPVPVVVFLSIVLFCYVLIRYSRYGRTLNAIGGNERAVFLAGIKPDQYIISVYALAGLLTAIAALVQTSRLGGVSPDTGAGYELRSLAAAVIGGISLQGGQGSLIGAALGVVFMGIVENAMGFLGLSPYFRTMLLGVLIVLIMVIGNIGKMK